MAASLGCGCGSSHPSVDVDDDGGPLRDGGSHDAAEDAGGGDAGALDGAAGDGGLPPTEECPCEAYCYFMRADPLNDLVVPAPGETWTRHGGRIVRTRDGVSERIALPEGGFTRAQLFGDDEPWVVVHDGGPAPERTHGLFRWVDGGWESHSIPPVSAVEVGDRRWLTVARAGERLLATYRNEGGAAFVFEEGEWVAARPWGDEWRPVAVDASAQVLAVKVSRSVDGEPVYRTWERRGSAPWAELAPPGDEEDGRLAVAGPFVATARHAFDGGDWVSLGGQAPRFGGMVAGVPWFVSEDEAIDLSSREHPVRHGLPFGASSAAFVPEGPLWVGGAAVAYWNGSAFTAVRPWAQQPLPTPPAGAFGAPFDFEVVSGPASDGRMPVLRFRDGLVLHRALPPVPWWMSRIRTQVWNVVEADGAWFVGFQGGVARTGGEGWSGLYPNADIDPALEDDAAPLLAARGSEVFAAVGARIYRWDGAAFDFEAEVPDVWRLNNLTIDEEGRAWAASMQGKVVERRSGGWEALSDPPIRPRHSPAAFSQSLHAHGGRVYFAGPPRDRHLATHEHMAVFEWDGDRWISTVLPGDGFGNRVTVAGRGEHVMAVDPTDIRLWRRRGSGDWVEDVRCPQAATGGAHFVWWPEGADRPWLMDQNRILRPRGSP
ncbi:MAG: hypothetical protein ACOC97_02690 [Myxococcota bacterium]